MRDCRKPPTPQLSAKGSTGSLKQVLGNQNSNLGDVEERLKQNEDQIKHINVPMFYVGDPILGLCPSRQ